ncbi:MAG: hypothetical protein BWY52_02980 [Chloroflexi bacterium ADurb.Bin325]|nr:MAG: hypothetical protein BWY52_02980 [Chloroflexi bacterium ADurb.Bin325]
MVDPPAEDVLGRLPEGQRGRDEGQREVGPGEKEQAQPGQRGEIDDGPARDDEQQRQRNGRGPQPGVGEPGRAVQEAARPPGQPPPGRPPEHERGQPHSRGCRQTGCQQPAAARSCGRIDSDHDPLQRPLAPPAPRLDGDAVLGQRQPLGHRDQAHRRGRIVQDEVGCAGLVHRQRVGPRAVHLDAVIGPVRPALHAQRQRRAVEGERQRVAVRGRVRGLGRDAPARAVAQRGMVGPVAARRQHGLRRERRQRLPRRGSDAVRVAQRKPGQRAVPGRPGTVGGPEERPQPRPLAADEREGLRRIRGLIRRGDAFPGCIPRACLPPERRGPQGRARVVVAEHHVVQEARAGKVQRRGIGRVVRRPCKAVGLRGHDVEPRRGVERIQRIQISQVAEVGPTGLGRRRERGEHDDRIRVRRAQVDCGLAQQAEIVRGIDRPRAPVRRDIRLLPDLVIAQLRAVAGRDRAHETSVVRALVRRGQGVVRVDGRARPGRRTVEDDHRLQRGKGGQRAHRLVPAGPLERAARRLDLVPGQREAQPADAGLLQHGERGGQRRVVQLPCAQVHARRGAIRGIDRRRIGQRGRQPLAARQQERGQAEQGQERDRPFDGAGWADCWHVCAPCYHKRLF